MARPPHVAPHSPFLPTVAHTEPVPAQGSGDLLQSQPSACPACTDSTDSQVRVACRCTSQLDPGACTESLTQEGWRCRSAPAGDSHYPQGEPPDDGLPKRARGRVSSDLDEACGFPMGLHFLLYRVRLWKWLPLRSFVAVTFHGRGHLWPQSPWGWASQHVNANPEWKPSAGPHTSFSADPGEASVGHNTFFKEMFY